VQARPAAPALLGEIAPTASRDESSDPAFPGSTRLLTRVHVLPDQWRIRGGDAPQPETAGQSAPPMAQAVPRGMLVMAYCSRPGSRVGVTARVQALPFQRMLNHLKLKSSPIAHTPLSDADARPAI
jgi:hypothetical protein